MTFPPPPPSVMASMSPTVLPTTSEDGAAMPSPDSATLVVQRPSQVWRDRWRSYVVLVDGVRVGKIRRGGEIVMPVAPGTHRVEARVDWTGSAPVEVMLHAGESAVLAILPAGGSAQALEQIGGRHGYLVLEWIA